MKQRIASQQKIAFVKTALPIFFIVALTGCGVNTDQNGDNPPKEKPPTQIKVDRKAAEKKRLAQLRTRLPKPTPGFIEIDGEQQGSLTPSAATRFGESSAVRVNFRATGEDQAFRDLCSGRVDMVDSSRLITANELRTCLQNGVELLTDKKGKVAPLQVGSDAVVLATKNEADVGGDCLRLNTARSIFRSGSTVTNWNQVGFNDLPLATTGREPQTSLFSFFAESVLGRNGDATLADVRSDYRLHRTDAAVREEVTNTVRVRQAKQRYETRLRTQRRVTQKARQRYVDRAIRAADRKILAKIKQENKDRARRKVSVSGAAAQQLEATNRRRVNQAKQAAARKAKQQFENQLVRLLQRQFRSDLARANAPGVVGVFRFTYYELFENVLRPIEIWDPQATGRQIIANNSNSSAVQQATQGRFVKGPNGKKIDLEQTPNCVFPSQKTVTSGIYPLSRRLLLYVAKHRLPRPEVQNFLTYYLNHAQQLATDRRLVPITDKQRLEQIALVTGKTPRELTRTTPATTTSRTGPQPSAPAKNKDSGASETSIPGVGR